MLIDHCSLQLCVQEGDVLYMPRGTIHQAVAQSADAVHLTVSTYQRWTQGDLAMRILNSACVSPDPSTAAPLALRKGLPWGFLHGSGMNPEVAGVI